MDKIGAQFLVFIVVGMLCIQDATAAFCLGFGSHLGQNKIGKLSFNKYYADLGVNCFRDEAYWHRLERKKGLIFIPPDLGDLRSAQYFSKSNGGSPLLIMNYGNEIYSEADFPSNPEAISAFLRYVDVLVSQTSNEVVNFELWNEWNIGMGSKDKPRRIAPVSDYVALARAVHMHLVARGYHANLILGSVAGLDDKWIDEFIRLGGLRYTSSFSIHPYVYRAGPSGRPENIYEWVKKLSSKLDAAAGRKIDIHVTEVGWPTYKGPYGATPNNAAAYLVRTVLLLRTLPAVKSIYWYELKENGSDPHEKEHSFGLVDQDGGKKPAYAALKAIARSVIEADSADLVSDGKQYKVTLTQGKKSCVAEWVPNTAAPPMLSSWVASDQHRFMEEKIPDLNCKQRQ
jgi:polysaccharide biosynthesis protein PslG